MAEVLGLGGIFFKCRDRDALAAWYGEHLGMDIAEWGSLEFSQDRLPKEAYGVWGMFEADTEYFDPSEKPYMINLVVDDVAGVLERAVAGGAKQIGGIDDEEYGSFGWFVDPEGNKIELWKPK